MTNHPDSNLPYFIHASTPSYRGTHMDGFHTAVLSAISGFVTKKTDSHHLNIFPGFVSPTDIRHLKEILDAFELPFILFPDYADTLDNEYTSEYSLIPEGGTPVEDIKKAGSAIASIEFGGLLHNSNEKNKSAGKVNTAGEWLELNYQVPLYRMNMPVGIDATDIFFKNLESLTERSIPEYLKKERGRLVDSYVDAHKYLFGKRAVVYGEEDLVIGIVSFLNEIGIKTVLAGSGGESNLLRSGIEKAIGYIPDDMIILNGLDFESINELSNELKPDLFIGNSKGYYISRRLGKPLIRVGFPIHDRIGGQRIQHLCYRGTQQLFDRIVNALLESKQEQSPVGFKYL
jgi:nitrogenase molybdenum-iron protein NifN